MTNSRVAGPEIDQMNAKAALDALHFVEPQGRIAEPPQELPLERRQPRHPPQRNSSATVPESSASQSKRNHELYLMVASSESSIHRARGRCFANELAPEEDLGDGVVAVEGRMEREVEELGERGIRVIEIPADWPPRPQHSMNCRPLPQGHGVIAGPMSSSAEFYTASRRRGPDRGKHAVRHANDLDHLANAVHPHDVSAEQHARRDGRGRPPFALPKGARRRAPPSETTFVTDR